MKEHNIKKGTSYTYCQLCGNFRLNDSNKLDEFIASECFATERLKVGQFVFVKAWWKKGEIVLKCKIKSIISRDGEITNLEVSPAIGNPHKRRVSIKDCLY